MTKQPVKYLLSRGTLYAILTILAIGGYLLIALVPGLLFGMTVTPANPFLVSFTVVFTTFLLFFVRGKLQENIDHIFFRGNQVHQEQLKIITDELSKASTVKDITTLLRTQINTYLEPFPLHIYLYDLQNDHFSAIDNSSDIRFTPNSPLPSALKQVETTIFINGDQMPDSLRPERGRIALLGTSLLIPLHGKDKLIGWVAMGKRRNGGIYDNIDVDFLQKSCRQVALALERAQVIENMEHRVHELNTLSRVAQGINITLNFDDTLELIYAQTAQIIPSSDFHLTLYNQAGQYLYYAFCLENEDRISTKENLPLTPKTNLDQEVINSHRPILAYDFASQCQSMGITPSIRGIYAWLGVPLNSGSETIGALSVSSNDPAISYTHAQLELLQAVADQAAGAIVKTQLLQETELRAQQLASLNEITRQLTSTLDLQPLLKNILENAVEILNSEAGSLFLVDEQTDDLVFHVTVGPVAENLEGQRLPAGTGFVGKAVMQRKPLIVNNVAATKTWNSNTDKQTGFITQAILAVPMEVKGRIIGVIEIINKKDGSIFSMDDQNLLSAFAGQAGVAIDNARLYTLTDQELSRRVEELSIMQRIDRELNTSLDMNRAMQTTLDWAMRQSKSEAALIGLVEKNGLRIITSNGYTNELEAYEKNLLPLEHPSVRQSIQTGSPRQNDMDVIDKAQTFLKGTRSQLILPIRRESKVIGLFLLESTRSHAFQQEALAFLSRLADHAAIAIANGELYTEVQQANIAKSEFVSFVAHELKNPMTSIKGYAELLSAGAVGPMSDMQSNFLSTIRSNIERMRTIVDDLNDNSKIEAGRLRLDFKAIQPAEIIESVVHSTRRQIEDKKQTINVQAPSDLPKIWADKTRTEQILVNLINNANKYTPESGLISVVAEKWKEDAQDMIHIWVQDNGLGMTPEDQKKVFQKFFRSEDDQARKSPGTGLGLNITKSLVEMQGGHIWFESEFRKGTTFHLTIPISEN